jgi:hypothetical protein
VSGWIGGRRRVDHRSSDGGASRVSGVRLPPEKVAGCIADIPDWHSGSAYSGHLPKASLLKRIDSRFPLVSLRTEDAETIAFATLTSQSLLQRASHTPVLYLDRSGGGNLHVSVRRIQPGLPPPKPAAREGDCRGSAGPWGASIGACRWPLPWLQPHNGGSQRTDDSISTLTP